MANVIKKRNVLFLGYREWAYKTYYDLVEEFDKEYNFKLAFNKDLAKNSYEWADIILMAGWSWIIPFNILEEIPAFGIHPSDLPKYRGGSPLQNQILDGIKNTKATLFKASKELDKGEIVKKEDLSLEGSMKMIFHRLYICSFHLFHYLLKEYPNILLTKQKENEGFTRKRIAPEQSELTREMFLYMTLEELYDFIRCREDPYPNVWIRDKKGNKLFFKHVIFEKKKS